MDCIFCKKESLIDNYYHYENNSSFKEFICSLCKSRYTYPFGGSLFRINFILYFNNNPYYCYYEYISQNKFKLEIFDFRKNSHPFHYVCDFKIENLTKDYCNNQIKKYVHRQNIL